MPSSLESHSGQQRTGRFVDAYALGVDKHRRKEEGIMTSYCFNK